MSVPTKGRIIRKLESFTLQEQGVRIGTTLELEQHYISSKITLNPTVSKTYIDH